ncbi:MAG: hypothetical protein AB2693_07315 [Candidatus Thiodiazotropha sp.]
MNYERQLFQAISSQFREATTEKLSAREDILAKLKQAMNYERQLFQAISSQFREATTEVLSARGYFGQVRAGHELRETAISSNQLTI